MANFAYNKTDRLREKRTRGWEGVQNPENIAYVLNGCSLRQSPLEFRIPRSPLAGFIPYGHAETGKKAWLFAKLQPSRARKRVNAT